MLYQKMSKSMISEGSPRLRMRQKKQAQCYTFAINLQNVFSVSF